MNQLKCSDCGNTFFQQLRPEEFDETNFIVWGKESLKPLSSSITAIKCLKCGMYHLPATSMAGKNQLAPEVQAYMRLLEAMKTMNPQKATMELVQGEAIAWPDFVTKEELQKELDRQSAQLEEIRKLIEKLSVTKEIVPNVKAGKRGK